MKILAFLLILLLANLVEAREIKLVEGHNADCTILTEIERWKDFEVRDSAEAEFRREWYIMVRIGDLLLTGIFYINDSVFIIEFVEEAIRIGKNGREVFRWRSE